MYHLLPVPYTVPIPPYTDIFHPGVNICSGTYYILINGHPTVCKFYLKLQDKICDFFKMFVRKKNWIPCYLRTRHSIEPLTLNLHYVFIKKTPRFSPIRNEHYTPSRYDQIPPSVPFISIRKITVDFLDKKIEFSIYGPCSEKISETQFRAVLLSQSFYSKSMQISKRFNTLVISWTDKIFLVFRKNIIQGGFKNVYFVYKVTKISEFSFKIKGATLKEPRTLIKDELDFTFHPDLSPIQQLTNCRVGLYKRKNVRETDIILPAENSKSTIYSKYWVYLSKEGIDVLLAMPNIKTVYQLMQIFLDVLTGLDQIHKVGCLHRDIKGENFILYSRYTRIEDIDDAGPIDTNVVSKMPCQTTRGMHLILRKKLIQNWNFKCEATLDNARYVRLWEEANAGNITKIFYKESFAAERNVMGFALAEIYLIFVAKTSFRDPKLEYIISRLLRYKLEKGDGDRVLQACDEPFILRPPSRPLFPNFNTLLKAINEDITTKGLPLVKDMVYHSIELPEAISLL